MNDLVYLIEQFETIEALATSLLKERYITNIYTDKRKFVNLIVKIYGANNDRQDSSHNLEPLPGRSVQINGTLFFIHGLVHPIPGNPMSDEYKEVLNKAVNGWTLLCEDGFKEDFFPSADIFGEVRALGINKPPHMIRTFPLFLAFSASVLYGKLRGRSPNVELKRIKTLDDLREIRSQLFRGYLPEPLGINAMQYVNPASLRLRRYIFEAEQAIKYAREKGVAELHLIVGCAHEMPLEYLLQHQNMIEQFKEK